MGVLWRDRSDDETGFLVLRQDLPEGSAPDNEVDFTEVAEVAANVNAFLDGSVTPGRMYRYGVVALRDGERSEILGPSVAVEATSEGVPLVDPDDEVGASFTSPNQPVVTMVSGAEELDVGSSLLTSTTLKL